MLLYHKPGQTDTVCAHILRGRFAALPEERAQLIVLGLGGAGGV